MTLRAQIKDRATIAAAKIRDAMQEFSDATGLSASVDVSWNETHHLGEELPAFHVRNVAVRFHDAADSR